MISRGRPSLSTLTTGGFLLIAVLWGGFLGWRQIDGDGSVLDNIEYLTVDWRFSIAGARPAPRGVVIAAIDDETIEKLGAFPLPRSVVARIVRGLAALKSEGHRRRHRIPESGQSGNGQRARRCAPFR